jgi:hypothetical protein
MKNPIKPKDQNIKTEFLKGGTVKRTNEKGEVEELSSQDYKDKYVRDGQYVSPEGVAQKEADRQRLVSQGLAEPTEEEAAQMQQEELIKQQQAASQALSLVDPNRNMNFNPQVPGSDVALDIAANIGQKAVIGATTLGIAGAGVGGVGAVPGAIAGAVGGGLLGAVTVLPELKSEYRENVQTEYSKLTGSRKAMNALINDLNKGLIPRDQALSLYNAEVNKVRQAKSNLLLLEENKWLGTAKPEIEEIDTFLNLELRTFNARFAQAIVTPDPNKFVLYNKETPENE